MQEINRLVEIKLTIKMLQAEESEILSKLANGHASALPIKKVAPSQTSEAKRAWYLRNKKRIAARRGNKRKGAAKKK